MANVYLITGASSDVGTALIQRILQEGDTVIAQGSGDLAQLAPLCKAHPGQKSPSAHLVSLPFC